jgi:hypothetical protein
MTSGKKYRREYYKFLHDKKNVAVAMIADVGERTKVFDCYDVSKVDDTITNANNCGVPIGCIGLYPDNGVLRVHMMPDPDSPLDDTDINIKLIAVSKEWIEHISPEFFSHVGFIEVKL